MKLEQLGTVAGGDIHEHAHVSTGNIQGARTRGVLLRVEGTCVTPGGTYPEGCVQIELTPFRARAVAKLLELAAELCDREGP